MLSLTNKTSLIHRNTIQYYSLVLHLQLLSNIYSTNLFEIFDLIVVVLNSAQKDLAHDDATHLKQFP